MDNYTIHNVDAVKRRDEDILATKHPSLVIHPNDPACILKPFEKNVHEISCLEGPAAFIDVLSPPYIVDAFGNGQRPCTYFKCDPSGIEVGDTNKVKLRVTKILDDFYSQRLMYCGPPLS